MFSHIVDLGSHYVMNAEKQGENEIISEFMTLKTKQYNTNAALQIITTKSL